MPTGELRIGANPNANGGKVRRELELPDIHAHEIPVAEKGHGWGSTEAARVFGEYTADVLAKTWTTSASSVPTRPRPTACRPLIR